MSNDDFSTKLATAVKAHRQKSGLSQMALAEYAGVGKTVIYDIEHGKQTVKLETVLKVLNVLNIKLELHSPLTQQEES